MPSFTEGIFFCFVRQINTSLIIWSLGLRAKAKQILPQEFISVARKVGHEAQAYTICKVLSDLYKKICSINMALLFLSFFIEYSMQSWVMILSYSLHLALSCSCAMIGMTTLTPAIDNQIHDLKMNPSYSGQYQCFRS